MPTSLSRTAIAAESRVRALFARVIVGSLVLLVLLMVGQIYRHWHAVSEPSTVVIVNGDGSLDGATVEVTGARGRWVEKLDSDDSWQASILLNPGLYHVTVKHRNLVIRDEDFSVDRTRGWGINLPSMVVIIGGKQLADARIEIVCDPRPDRMFAREEIKLEAKDHYRKAIYLFPGSYHAVARSALSLDRVLAKVDFTVDRTAPVRVDLVKAASEDGAP